MRYLYLSSLPGVMHRVIVDVVVVVVVAFTSKYIDAFEKSFIPHKLLLMHALLKKANDIKSSVVRMKERISLTKIILSASTLWI